MLLAMSSGLTDALVYILHGGVFAFAMTGNLVLLGVSVATHDTGEVFRHMVPLLGFAAGVLAGKSMLRWQRSLVMPVTMLLQATVLLLAGLFAGRLHSNVLVITLSVSGGILVTVLRKVGDIPFNIAFMTGNLRAVIVGAFDAVFPPEHSTAVRGASEFRIVGLTCAGFLCGAAIGGTTAHRLQNHAFWIAALLFFVAGYLLRRAETTEA
ncbi:YoaK family protein [Terriglobus roseus]|uniref:YoaK family protein n=1 Tax=Terriglobus roseus TaxID=392734 RepID=UPI001BB062E7|nr:YoaK family protein [Terriglobus roseus]